jgi:hypothetical protein
VADSLEETLVDLAVELHFPLPALMDPVDRQREPAREPHGTASLRAAAGSGQSHPTALVAPDRVKQKDLDPATLRVCPVEARVPDSDVVAHQEVARREQLGQIREGAVHDGSGGAIENEEPALPSWSRDLSDPLGRQVVVEEIDAHGA